MPENNTAFQAATGTYAVWKVSLFLANSCCVLYCVISQATYNLCLLCWIVQGYAVLDMELWAVCEASVVARFVTVSGIFAEGIFADGIFAEGFFAEWNFLRTDFWPNEIFT